jgi:hypothetical protein
MREETVSERYERSSCVVCCVRRRDSVVMVNFDLTPAPTAMLRKHVYDLCIVMFCSVEIRMLETGRASVAPAIKKLRISLTPILDVTYLFGPRNEVL